MYVAKLDRYRMSMGSYVSVELEEKGTYRHAFARAHPKRCLGSLCEPERKNGHAHRANSGHQHLGVSPGRPVRDWVAYGQGADGHIADEA